LIDLADVVTPRELERAFDEAHYLRLDLSGLSPVRGRRGAGRLAALLAKHELGCTRTRNDFEERLLGLCRRAGLPLPRVNEEVEGFEVDFSWPQARLIVETDGWQAHGTRAAFERDRLRDATLIAAGWRPLRITWRRLESEPEAVAVQLRTLLAQE
jgi:very-short-patch-repair endonuclease